MKSFAPKPWVVPQPVLIIGTYNKDGVANAMNAAWAGQWDMKEIMISMGNHVTTDNLKNGGEFTVAFATKKTMVGSDFVGIVSAKNDPKKMEKTGWNIKKATMVNAPVFTDFPMTLECRIKEKIDESEEGYYIVAEIVNILVDENYLAEDGKPNAMNAAWGGQWDAKEIMIAMGAHATTENLNDCPDFTVAFATKQTMVAADFVGIVSAKNDTDKMAKTGWKWEKSEHVNAPVFTDFPMTLECRIKEKIDESEEGYYIVAEIVNILVDENYLAEDGKPDMEKMELIVFDPIHHGYIELGKTIGKAFSDGKALK